MGRCQPLVQRLGQFDQRFTGVAGQLDQVCLYLLNQLGRFRVLFVLKQAAGPTDSGVHSADLLFLFAGGGRLCHDGCEGAKRDGRTDYHARHHRQGTISRLLKRHVRCSVCERRLRRVRASDEQCLVTPIVSVNESHVGGITRRRDAMASDPGRIGSVDGGVH